MNAWWWLLWAAAWLGVGTVIACQIGHARRAESERDRIVAAARERTAGMVPCAPDNEEGTRLDWADECALIYSMPAYDPAWDAGMERLWDAIRDEQQKGEL